MRIMAIDYGGKRTGIAVTDPLQIIATGLTTVDSAQIFTFLQNYIQQEPVERFVVGEPKNWDDSDTHATPLVAKFVAALAKKFPQIPITLADERYTSVLAKQSMIQSGMKRKNRQNKKLVDEIAATILLQEYLARV
jgi:putative holliday junction resolvase